ncbi:hypothetical protein BDA96_03G400600 [Sorghum bicolor]|uniref:Uncharacterized protein n=1 Tax=Sorghum bicolor TaxID=4558 RepID=A0A921RJP6_SORBI|nr:hypothetical protein BDA96_03G400600 [Sorghum bicolor]
MRARMKFSGWYAIRPVLACLTVWYSYKRLHVLECLVYSYKKTSRWQDQSTAGWTWICGRAYDTSAFMRPDIKITFFP